MNKAQNLNEIVNYQDGSVVSKALVNKPVGTVTMFAFGQGEGLSEHAAPYDALLIVTDGKAEVTLGGEKHIVGSGEMLIMPANIPHAVKAVEAFKMLLIMIKS
jgi:quercetin dioxygenase-like cupin family protein